MIVTLDFLSLILFDYCSKIAGGDGNETPTTSLRFTKLIVTLSFLSSILFSCSSDDGSGSGNETLIAPPRLAKNEKELKTELEKCGAGCTLKLVADITLDTTWSPIGTYDAGFKGTIDGDNFKISGLIIDADASDNQGLLGVIDASGIVKNLILKDPNIKGKDNVGSLAGRNHGKIENVKVIGGSVTSANDKIGGLVGYNYEGDITNSYALGNVAGNSNVGGLVGYQEKSRITNSYAIGDASGNIRVGGLVGHNHTNSEIKNSHAVTATSGISNIGGLVGTNDWNSTITNSHAIGNASGDSIVGGLVGNNSGNIKGNYALGTASGTGRDVGGLVGYNNADISNSYALGAVSGNKNVGGLVGNYQYGSITNSYSLGKITKIATNTANIGGFIGNYIAGGVSASYYDKKSSGQGPGAIGSGQSLPGLVGVSTMTNIRIDVTGGFYYDDSDNNGIFSTDVKIFTGWSFSGANAIWKWVKDGIWPKLAWQE